MKTVAYIQGGPLQIFTESLTSRNGNDSAAIGAANLVKTLCVFANMPLQVTACYVYIHAYIHTYQNAMPVRLSTWNYGTDVD
jgi:hypothetical protein